MGTESERERAAWVAIEQDFKYFQSYISKRKKKKDNVYHNYLTIFSTFKVVVINFNVNPCARFAIAASSRVSKLIEV